MKNTVRIIAAVLAGAVAWAALWNLGTRVAQAALPVLLQPGEPISHLGVLLAYIGYSVCLSLFAGFITALAAGRQPMPAVWVLATLQLALGLYFEVSYWSLLPVWYHLVFLALIVPATVFGGSRRPRGRLAGGLRAHQGAV